MILERGNMWDVFGKTDWFLITTNPIVNKQGFAVMGRGIAKEAADKFSTIRKDFATKLLERKDRFDSNHVYTIGTYEGKKVGCFMVKSHWAENASLLIIKESVERLVDILDSVGPIRVDLNFPGIGNGKLKREDVLPLLQGLPDNVHVWEKE